MWLTLALPVEAATRKTPAKPTATKAVKKPLAKAPRSTRRGPPRQAFAEVGAADILAADSVGLHGSASFYGQGFQGRKTSTGERFDTRKFTAASNHFPLGSLVAVRRLDKDLCAIVKVNDRMSARHQRRIIDVSRGVAEYLDMLRAGVVIVRVAAIRPGTPSGDPGACQAAFEAERWCADCVVTPRLPAIEVD